MSHKLHKFRSALMKHQVNGQPIVPPQGVNALETGLLEKLNQQEALYTFLNSYAKTYPNQALTRDELQKLSKDITDTML